MLMDRYIITDDKNYVVVDNSGKYSLTTILSDAYKWSKENSALNVMDNLKKSILKKSHNKVKVVCVKEDIKTSGIVIPIEEAKLDFDFKEEVKSPYVKVEQLEKRKEYLEFELSETNKKLQDIQHCAEFYNLNASQGYKLYKILHETRVKRREIKNELESIGYLLDGKLSSKTLKNIDKSIYGVYNNKKYKPRIVDELFDLIR